MNYIKVGILFLATAVVFGAFGAHGLENKIDEHSLKAWHTGVEYQFYHGLGLLLLSALSASGFMKKERMEKAQLLLMIGTLCFSGSIYLLTTSAITGLSINMVLGPITPIGGLLMIIAWTLAFFSVQKKAA